MEVRWAVIVVQHIDYDPKESRDFGHVLGSPIVWSFFFVQCLAHTIQQQSKCRTLLAVSPLFLVGRWISSTTMQYATGPVLDQHDQVVSFDEVIVLCSLLRSQRSLIRLLTKVVKPFESGWIVQSQIDNALCDFQRQASRHRVRQSLNGGQCR